MPRRFSVTPERIVGDRVFFDREESRHIGRVLRLRPGDVVVAGAAGSGLDHTVRLERVGLAASGRILLSRPAPSESPLAVTLVQGVTKGAQMDAIVRSVTELGAVAVLPALTEHTVVRLEGPAALERARRWQRIAGEAAKQCGRGTVPAVAAPQPLGACLDAAAGTELKLCLWERGGDPLADALAGRDSRPVSAAALVGPEGGLTEAEVDAARARGFRVVGAGPRILRAETAGPTIVALLQFTLGDLGRGDLGRA